MLLCLAFSGTLLVGCGSETAVQKELIRPVRTSNVMNVADIEHRSFPGRAQATQEVELSFRVDGPLITLPIKVGDKIDKGDVVARIDPRDFEVRLRNTQGQLQKAEANLDRASSEFKRLQAIRKKDPQLVSEVHLERAREAFELGKADVVALEATVDAAKDELSYTQLKAPFDGTVVAQYVENFEYLQSQQPVLRLLDSQRIEFVFNVPETMISLIGQIGNIRVRFDAFPEAELSAQVHEIGSEASASTRTYPITLIMEQPEGVEILPGMAGKVTGARLSKGQPNVAIVIPVTAVFSPQAGSESYVWIVGENGIVTRRTVELGSVRSHGIEVRAGLSAGDVVATAGVNFLQEGQRVRPLTE